MASVTIDHNGQAIRNPKQTNDLQFMENGLLLKAKTAQLAQRQRELRKMLAVQPIAVAAIKPAQRV